MNGEANVNGLSNNVFVGNQNFGSGENDSQTQGVHGVAVPIAVNGVSVTFDWNLFTWDSFNAIDGYYDSFSVTLTKNEPYWDKLFTDPVVGDAVHSEILDVTPAFTFLGGAVNEEFGGYDFGNGTLEISSSLPQTFNLVDSGNPIGAPGNYFVNFVLDTNTNPSADSAFPSWGTYSGVDVSPVPEPSTLFLLGSGLIGLAAWKAKQRKGYQSN